MIVSVMPVPTPVQYRPGGADSVSLTPGRPTCSAEATPARSKKRPSDGEHVGIGPIDAPHVPSVDDVHVRSAADP